MKWHEGLKKWVGYATAIPVLYLACRYLPVGRAEIFCDYAFRVFLVFVIGDVVAEHIVGKWLNKNGN